MARKLVDSSVLVALFNKDDGLHERAVKATEALEEPLVIHEYVAVETATVLLTRANKALADAFLDILLTNADFELLYTLDSGFSITVSEFKTIKSKQLSFVDTSLLSLSAGYEVLTFDDALNRAIKKKAEAFASK